MARPPIHAYTDGSCSGNPGPAGVGVVLLSGRKRKEISAYIGEGTNNVAELMAIKVALGAIRDRQRTVFLYSDSAYALGLLGKSWKPKKNQGLVAELRALTKAFPDLRYVKVAGHAGVKENERCDELARKAVETRGPTI